MISFAAVILAAGASSRMGRPKMLLPWRDTSIIGHELKTWRQAGARQIAVVCSGDNHALLDELDRLELPPGNRIINPDPARGMFSSIQCAARWTGWDWSITHWALTPGDQPQVSVETLRLVLDHADAEREFICQPSHDGRARHPVILPRTDWLELTNASDATLKEFLAARQARRSFIEIPDPALDCDIDTPADYEQVTARFGG